MDTQKKGYLTVADIQRVLGIFEGDTDLGFASTIIKEVDINHDGKI